MPFKTVNPATGELVRSFEEISDRDLELVLGTAHKAYETDWRLRPVAERARIVSRAAAILREKTEEYAGYLTLEMGKRIAEARSEVGVAAAILDYYAKKAESYLKPKLLPESPGAELHTSPIGVVLGKRRHRLGDDGLHDNPVRGNPVLRQTSAVSAGGARRTAFRCISPGSPKPATCWPRSLNPRTTRLSA